MAPRDLRTQLIDLIEHEMTFGGDGRITAKLNSLADPGMVEALYRASQAGVQIDLLVRGICCLRPGVPGLSENIRVRSILGRYLEHSRIIRFEHGEDDAPLFLIGSADWMGRNLDRRIEVMVPVVHPKHQAWLDQVLDVRPRRRHRPPRTRLPTASGTVAARPTSRWATPRSGCTAG